MIEFGDEKIGNEAVIRVVGVGGAGGNAINAMIDANLRGVEFIAVNTDSKDLRKCKAPMKVQIGDTGLGAGSDPQKGQRAAQEARDKLQGVVEGADMVFVTAGLGGGTGTGASPVIAELAKSVGALTVAVVTKPFDFEGRVRYAQAEDGIKELRNVVDALIVVPNQKLIDVVDKSTSLLSAFDKSNDILRQGVQSISDLITGVGQIVVDFEDVRTIMSDAGSALMGIGIDAGENRAQRATEKAISSPLLEEASMQGAKGVLVNVAGNKDITLHEVNEAMSIIRNCADPDANIIWGLVIDEELNDKMKVTVIATGFDSMRRERTIGAKASNLDDILRSNFELSTSMRRRRSFTRGIGGVNTENSLEDELEIPPFLRAMRKQNGKPSLD